MTSWKMDTEDVFLKIYGDFPAIAMFFLLEGVLCHSIFLKYLFGPFCAMCFWDRGVKLLLHKVIGGFWMFSLSRVELKLFSAQASPTMKRSSVYHWTDPIEHTSCFVTHGLSTSLSDSRQCGNHHVLTSWFSKALSCVNAFQIENDGFQIEHFRNKTSEKIKTWILTLSLWPSNCPLKQLSNGYNLWL